MSDVSALVVSTFSGILFFLVWYRRRRDLPWFHPFRLTALFLAYSAAVALPITFLASYEPMFLPPVGLYRSGIRSVALIHLVLAFFVSIAQGVVARLPRPAQMSPYAGLARLPPPGVLRATGWPIIFLGSGVQLFLYLRFGGIGGYVDAAGGLGNRFQGLGPVLLVAESVPLILFCLLLFGSRRRLSGKVIWGTFVMTLAFFGGLRGSRVVVILNILIALALWTVRRGLPRRRTLIIVCLVGFSGGYAYNYLKAFDVEVVSRVREARSFAELNQSAQRSPIFYVTEDFSRVPQQAYVLALHPPSANSQLGYGVTYLNAMTRFVPKGLLGTRPISKTQLLTDQVHGRGVFQLGLRRETRVLGPIGEGVINFGAVPGSIIGAAILLIAAGLSSTLVRIFLTSGRAHIAVLLAFAGFAFVHGDMDNGVLSFMQFAALPLAWFSGSSLLARS